VCVLLDVMAIKLPPVGFDLLAGIKNKRRQHSLIGMLAAIIIYKPKTMIETRYKELYELKQVDPKEVKSELKQELTQVKPEKTTPIKTKIVKLEHGLKGLEHKVKMYIFKNYQDGEVINVKEVRENFNLSARQWAGIRDNLNVLTTRGTKTIVVAEKKEGVK
jgi:hypothetical protein